MLGLREFQDERADVVARYLPEEAKRLQKEGEISANVDLSTLVEGNTHSNDDYNNITFAAGDDSDEEDVIGWPTLCHTLPNLKSHDII